MLKSYECTGRMNPVSAALWIGRMVSLSIVRFEGLWSPLIRCRAGILLVLLWLGCILGATLLAVFIFCTLWLYRVTRPAKNQEESFQMNQTMNGAHTVDDSKLATSAQRYHFEYQKRQMLSRTLSGDGDPSKSPDLKDDAKDTIYAYPGLGPTTPLELENPIYCEHAMDVVKSNQSDMTN
ncbi:hypothetical protein T265_05390 [Opisthorchis viverrini]|uniref:Uncharacterized protein n=1 Tax=Opisthorchis viverrini TaxID=6198 RepID=A0A074ZKK6_OPIVI|nr:hypothetical protein T265_05390 [Opisthorchis viverrini]KER27571.1 hypothetical protein T265_05390 [Opisthorchis viverrini]